MSLVAVIVRSMENMNLKTTTPELTRVVRLESSGNGKSTNQVSYIAIMYLLSRRMFQRLISLLGLNRAIELNFNYFSKCRDFSQTTVQFKAVNDESSTVIQLLFLFDTEDITAILSPKECILAYVNLFRIFMTLPWYLSFIKRRFHTIPARTVACSLIWGGGDVSLFVNIIICVPPD